MSCVRSCDILLPSKDADLYKYSCIACDQFTSDKNYWNSVEEIVKDAPSTYRMTFPEIYLSKDNTKRTEEICSNMNSYLSSGFFRTLENSVIYVERTQFNGCVRKGLVLAVDLEEYDFSKNSKSKIRATEGTIEDRLPPRVKIRQNAPLELPHIMILIDDRNDEVFGFVKNASKTQQYSTDLMMNGGSIKGWSIDEPEKVISLLDKVTGARDIEYAVGDGNHSLATAKRCWENLKPTLTDAEKANHPARFALCEIVNLYDTSLVFEPIHRIMFNTDFGALKKYFNFSDSGHCFKFVVDGKEIPATIKATHEICVGSVQTVLDKFLAENPDSNIDYVHEAEQITALSKNKNTIGILLPAMEKTSLFDAVENFGSLPRKTFSMGEGKDKRYYFEARKIQ